MSSVARKLVERFYGEVWNEANERVAREILSDAFRFRGSLGPEKRGVDGFIEYMRSIHQALADYQCIIDGLVVDDDRVAARMTFKGRHQATFFGVEATGREIAWAGRRSFALNAVALPSCGSLAISTLSRRSLARVYRRGFRARRRNGPMTVPTIPVGTVLVCCITAGPGSVRRCPGSGAGRISASWDRHLPASSSPA